MSNEKRCVFGGWEPVPGKSGEFRANVIEVPVTHQFTQFTEQSRARWDVGEWLKVKIKQLADKRTPIKKA